MTLKIRTTNLVIEPLTLLDAPFIISLLNSPGWLKYIGDRQVKTEMEAIGYLEHGPLESYRIHGFGLMRVGLQDGTAIGMCGLLKRDYLSQPDLGFAFLPEFSGKGYAYESTSAYLHAIVDTVRPPSIFAITLPSNDRSLALLNKLGFRISGPIMTDKEELLLLERQCRIN